jgi:hypothetical protein
MERSNSCPTCRAEIPSDNNQNAFPGGQFPPNLFARQQRNQAHQPARNIQPLHDQVERELDELERLIGEYNAGLEDRLRHVAAQPQQNGIIDEKEDEGKEQHSYDEHLILLQRHALMLEEEMDSHRRSLVFLQKQYQYVVRMQQAIIRRQ